MGTWSFHSTRRRGAGSEAASLSCPHSLAEREWRLLTPFMQTRVDDSDKPRCISRKSTRAQVAEEE